MWRILHIIAIVALLVAAGAVYVVKYDAMKYAERVARLEAEIGRERDAIAILRAEWTQLARPERVQALADRHLQLRPMQVGQLDSFADLPERPRDFGPDPIAGILQSLPDLELQTGTARPRPPAPRPERAR